MKTEKMPPGTKVYCKECGGLCIITGAEITCIKCGNIGKNEWVPEGQEHRKEALEKIGALIENQQDSDPRISKMVDEHFWELS